MKTKTTIIALLSVFLMLAVPSLASVALPPNDPPADAPGKEIPRELQIIMDEVQRYHDEVLRPCLERAALTGVGRERCLEAWRVFSEGTRHALQEGGFIPGRLTKTMTLPNGNSPGNK